MRSTYLLPWFKMTTWYFRLSRLLEVSNVKKRTKNHSADADRIFMLVKNHVLAVSGMGEVRPRYSCFYKIRHPGDCDGQSGYGVSKLDSIVEEVVRQIFAQFREVSRKKLLESVKTNDAARIQKKVKKIQKDLESKQKELDDLKAETILVIRGVSALDKELLGTLVAEAREALETLEKQFVQAQEEYEEATKTAKRSNYICNELLTWADVYDTANHDERRAILQQFIKVIRVRKDYEISITLNASFNQVEQLKAVSTYDGAEIFEGISEKGGIKAMRLPAELCKMQRKKRETDGFSKSTWMTPPGLHPTSGFGARHGLPKFFGHKKRRIVQKRCGRLVEHCPQHSNPTLPHG